MTTHRWLTKRQKTHIGSPVSSGLKCIPLHNNTSQQGTICSEMTPFNNTGSIYANNILFCYFVVVVVVVVVVVFVVAARSIFSCI